MAREGPGSSLSQPVDSLFISHNGSRVAVYRCLLTRLFTRYTQKLCSCGRLRPQEFTFYEDGLALNLLALSEGSYFRFIRLLPFLCRPDLADLAFRQASAYGW